MDIAKNQQIMYNNHRKINMNNEQFIAGVQEMHGLTSMMVEHLIAISPKLNDEKRAETFAKLTNADNEIMNALSEQEILVKQQGEELHAIEHIALKAEERGEHEEEVSTAEAMLNTL
jgi:hypothetical protein